MNEIRVIKETEIAVIGGNLNAVYSQEMRRYSRSLKKLDRELSMRIRELHKVSSELLLDENSKPLIHHLQGIVQELQVYKRGQDILTNLEPVNTNVFNGINVVRKAEELQILVGQLEKFGRYMRKELDNEDIGHI